MAPALQNRGLHSAWLVVRCLEILVTLAALYVAIHALPKFILPIAALTLIYCGYSHYAELLGRSFPSPKLLMQADMLVARHGWKPEPAAEWPYLLDIFLTIGKGGPIVALLLALPDIRSSEYFIEKLVGYAGVILCAMFVWGAAFALWYRATKRVNDDHC